MDPFNHFTNSAVESLRRTQELAAGGAIVAQMRRMQELAAGGAMAREIQNLRKLGIGHLRSVDAAADAGRLFSEGATETARRTLDALSVPPRSHTTERFTVEVEEEQPVTEESPQPTRSAAPRDTDDQTGMVQFGCGQLAQCQTMEEFRAVQQYFLRNRLFV